MGSDPSYFFATAVFRSFEPPYVLGGISMLQGYFGAWLRRENRLDDVELRTFIRAYQRRALFVGRAKAVADYLEASGVSASQLKVTGKSESEHVAKPSEKYVIKPVFFGFDSSELSGN